MNTPHQDPSYIQKSADSTILISQNREVTIEESASASLVSQVMAPILLDFQAKGMEELLVRITSAKREVKTLESMKACRITNRLLHKLIK